MRKTFIAILLLFSIIIQPVKISMALNEHNYQFYRDQVKNEIYWIPNEDLSIKHFILDGKKVDLTSWGDLDNGVLHAKKDTKYLLPPSEQKFLSYEINFVEDENSFIEQDILKYNRALGIKNFDYEVLLNITADQSFKLNLDLRNQSQGKIEKIETELLLPEDSFQLLSGNRKQNFNSFDKNESVNLKYTLYSKKGIESKSYEFSLITKYTIGNTIFKEEIPFRINISGKTNNKDVSSIDNQDDFFDGSIQSNENTIDPNIFGGGSTQDSSNYDNFGENMGTSGLSGQNDGTIKNKPKLIVDNYGYTPNPLQAGQDFKLTLSFLNTNKDKSIRNIRIVLNSTAPMQDDYGGKESNLNLSSSSIFTPIDSSNTFYIDYIGPKDRKQKTITLTTPRDISPQTYELSVALDYEDKSGNEYNTTEVVGIPIIQETKLELGTPELPSYMEVNMPQSLSIDFYNTGKSPLYNLMINTSGDFEIEGAGEYFGNFQPGNSETFDVTITPTKVGVNKGEIKFSYEDVAGKPHEIVREFSINVEESLDMDGEFMDNEQLNNDRSNKGFLWLILAILAAGLTTIILRKKNKNKQDKDLKLDE